MCGKACQNFKQVHLVVLTSPTMAAPKALRVFKMPPTQRQIQEGISTNVVGKLDPQPYMYSDKPSVHVLPIHIPIDILYT